MKILGIESSCDETSVGVVEDGFKVLSNVIFSQIDLHKKTGGVVPEVAAREHVVKILPVFEEALEMAGVGMKDIDGIAVTQGPGLLSSLITGVTFGNTLAMAFNKPLIGVNHISGHIYANWLDRDDISFPVMVLTVSGGHNELVFMRGHYDFEIIGESLDDAAGEAFDKVARLLGLGYPGGPEVSRVALEGDAGRFDFPKSYLGNKSFDFSFSGLKTAVLNVVKEEFDKKGELSDEFVADCAASFQEAVVGVLSDKLLRAAVEYGVEEVHLAGGVSANRRLREVMQEKIDKGFYFRSGGKKVFFDKGKFKLRFNENLALCTDNAGMIATAGYFKYIKEENKNVFRDNIIVADPNLDLLSF